MSIRTRTRIEYGPPGLAVRSGVPYGHGPVVSMLETVVDDTSPGDHRSFKVDRWTYKGGRCHLAGDHDGVGGYGSFYNFMPDGFRNIIASGSYSHSYVPGDKGDFAYSTIAAARTNPSRPYVDVPVNCLQLGELTTLIRDSGRSIIKASANVNLALQFGLMPLVSDLYKLTSYRDKVVDRVKELERLQSGRGLRRTIALGELDNLEVNNTYTGNDLCQTVYREFYGGPYVNKTQLEIGAHIRWMPDLTSMPMTDEQMHAKARQAVLGLTFDASSVWELLPWSWMIDWASTMGDYLAATRNIIPAYPAEISILRRTRSSHRFAGWSATIDGFTRKTDPWEIDYITKARNRTDVVSPTAHMPFLSANQMGIVASLGVLRA